MDVDSAMKKIYLDCCSLQRPFDNRSQLRIHVEAEAILAVLSLFESGKVFLLSSEITEYEINRIADQDRKFFCLEYLKKMSTRVSLNKEVKDLAKNYSTRSIDSVDALHLASANFGEADYFCTCDDKLYKKASILKLDVMKVVKPLELIEEIENET